MAAGQGFKTFVTGEVLTSGDVNGYLMQGINVFANATARDAAITAPAEGQFAFTKDNNSLWYYDGAAWVASGATGDIEGVTAGVGISGGGTSGTVTITNSMATEIAAKGDLIAGTGSQTFDNLPVGANNTVLTADSTTATGLKWATSSSFAGCSLWKSADQTISNNVGTNVLFNNEEFDTNGFHSTTTNTERITIPSGYAGKYLLVCEIYFAYVNSTGSRSAGFLKNGNYLSIGTRVGSGTSAVWLCATAVADLAVDDYVTVTVMQNSGGNLDITGGQENIRFAAIYLGA